MEWMKGEYSKLISFVSAGTDVNKTNKNKKKKHEGNLDGKEVKNFYEELINDKNCALHSVKDVKEVLCPEKQTQKFHIPNESKEICTLDINRFLRYAQEGNIRQVKSSLNRGVSVDSRDSFGWTALMCAAHSGQIETVKHLLSVGAKIDMVNFQNENAAQIALTAGFMPISRLIEKFQNGRYQDNFSDEHKNEVQKLVSFFCEVCRANFTETNMKGHETSTVHLFNTKKKAKDDPFLLPSSNKGYRMMLRSGWDCRKGLGSEGQGQKYPVKTILKRDRKCLGSETHEKPKITHFNANDKKAVIKNPERKVTKRILNKREQKIKERRHKQWERNLRTSMSLDC